MQKELSIKFDYFIEEKLERCAFKSNESSHSSIGEMMQKYEKMYSWDNSVRMNASS